MPANFNIFNFLLIVQLYISGYKTETKFKNIIYKEINIFRVIFKTINNNKKFSKIFTYSSIIHEKSAKTFILLCFQKKTCKKMYHLDQVLISHTNQSFYFNQR